MMRLSFSSLPVRRTPLLLAALLLCALAGFCPHVSAARGRGLVAVPSTILQIQAPAGHAAGRHGARLRLTFPTRGYAHPAVYRRVRGRWVRIPSRIIRRTRRTTTLVAALSRFDPHARYAVLAHRRHRRSPGKVRPSLRGPIVGSPPVLDGH